MDELLFTQKVRIQGEIFLQKSDKKRLNAEVKVIGFSDQNQNPDIFTNF